MRIRIERTHRRIWKWECYLPATDGTGDACTHLAYTVYTSRRKARRAGKRHAWTHFGSTTYRRANP